MQSSVLLDCIIYKSMTAQCDYEHIVNICITTEQPPQEVSIVTTFFSFLFYSLLFIVFIVIVCFELQIKSNSSGEQQGKQQEAMIGCWAHTLTAYTSVTLMTV